MDTSSLPPQLQHVLSALAGAVGKREPAIRARVEELRAENPQLTLEELAQKLVVATRRRVAASGAASGAAAIAPGLGTLLSLGAATSQALYALEQETELVLAIAIVYGHDLTGNDERILEALVVVGIAGGAVKLREDILVVGGQRIAVAAIRHGGEIAGKVGGHVVGRVLARVAGSRALSVVGRAAPLAIGMVVGAGFDWITVSALGKAAIRYYGPGGPASRHPVLASAPGREDGANVKLGN